MAGLFSFRKPRGSRIMAFMETVIVIRLVVLAAALVAVALYWYVYR
ncbi:MAG: hypothetical protein HY914_16255 [Desulfomonile tiedjei]|nr:hypothetical protein [Desulfomonile tiedjei]